MPFFDTENNAKKLLLQEGHFYLEKGMHVHGGDYEISFNVRVLVDQKYKPATSLVLLTMITVLLRSFNFASHKLVNQNKLQSVSAH